MKPFALTVLVGCLAAALGCRDAQESHGHSHGPPHGGTPVVVAEHKYHLELVRDATNGVMQAYVLDGDLHDSIAVPETNFALMASFGGKTERLDFQRTSPADPSSLFEGRAEWVKNAKSFEGVIPSITLKGQTFTNVTFPFPKGTQHTH
jgi:hypothetical protein